MKPDEIKRCLEVCINDDCDNCKHSFGNCVRNLMTNTLAYINELETEVEKFTTAYPKTFESIRKIYTTAKSEAIKEFMDSLKAKAQNATTWTGIEPVVTISDIEDTAKDLLIDDDVTK